MPYPGLCGSFKSLPYAGSRCTREQIVAEEASVTKNIEKRFLIRAWGAGATEKGAIGTIPSNSGEYSLTVTVRGPGSFIHLKVAGAFVTQWTL